MDYNEALDYIFSIPKFSYPLGNEKLAGLLRKLGSPQEGMRVIHLAGTNGKGSAAAMLCSILEHAGCRTGLFTSPYIQRFNERIRIGAEQIPDKELAKIADRVRSAGAQVSQFAFILACALVYYKEQQCDFVILEAGMGGRLDATNVIDQSMISVIMSIGLDHTAYLGNAIAEIAEEKCGIIKQGGTVAAYRNADEAAHVIEQSCKEKNARLILAPEAEKTDDGFVAGGVEYKLSLKGEYQAGNAAAVLAAVKGMRDMGVNIPDKAVHDGFADCRWPARFQYVRNNIIVDGGHNPDGIEAISRSLRGIRGKKTAVAAMMEDKAVYECMKLLSRAVDEIIVTQLDMPRCMSADKLAQLAADCGAKVTVIADYRLAFAAAERIDGTAIICGSLFLAGKALDYFGEDN